MTERRERGEWGESTRTPPPGDVGRPPHDARVNASTPPDEAARLLAEAEATRVPIAPVRTLLPARDLAAAYRTQEINIMRREAAGAVRTGRKVGLTAPAVQRQFDVDQPDYGVLLEGIRYGDGAAVDVGSLIHPKIEAEVAFELAEDITATDEASVRRAVAWAIPSLEIVDCRIRDYDIDIVDTIADNAACAGYVLGAARVPLDRIDLPAVRMTLTGDDGERLSEGTGADCLGDPLHALQWLARAAIDQGRPLRKGEIVLSGSLGPIAVLRPGRAYTATFDGLGAVSITATDKGDVTTVNDVDHETRVAIEALVAEHAYLVDHNLHDRLHELYAPDGQLLGLPGMHFTTRDAIREWGLKRSKETGTVVRHLQSNLRLHWEDGVLRGSLYYQMLRGSAEDPGDPVPASMGEFNDEYVHRDGRWLIRRRVIDRLFFTPPGGAPSGGAGGTSG